MKPALTVVNCHPAIPARRPWGREDLLRLSGNAAAMVLTAAALFAWLAFGDLVLAGIADTLREMCNG
jgi:hypothetical protein